MRAKMIVAVVAGSVGAVFAVPSANAGPAPRLELPCDGGLHRVASPARHSPSMEGVGGSGPGDVWVAGGSIAPDVIGPVYWHWNGSAWRVEMPTTSNFATATDVDVLGPDDAWSVGWQIGGNLIQHWDGSAWRSVPTGLPVHDVGLEAIDSISRNNLWAVGAKQPTNGPNFVPRSYVVHTTDAGWHTVPQPDGAADGSVLMAVAAVSRRNVWAVGGTGLGKQVWYDSPRTLIEHWNGERWRVVPSPSPGSRANVLQAVAEAGPHDIWAVGLRSSVGHPDRPLVLHFDGTAWREVPSPWRAGDNGDLFDVSSSPSMGVWAFGRRSAPGSDNSHPFAERLGSHGWRLVAQSPRWGALYGGWAGDREIWTVGETADGQRVAPFVERAC